MGRVVLVIVVLAAATMFALPRGRGLVSPIGRMQSIRAMLSCEAGTLGQLSSDPSTAAAAGRRCLPSR